MKVAVFGLGYVGTVTAACLAANGHDVWGVDVDASKVDAVMSGYSPVVEPGLRELVAQGRASGRLHATTSVRQAVDDSDVSLICVGTPSTAQGGANLSYIDSVVEDLTTALAERSAQAQRIHCVVMRSTVPPGTVESTAPPFRPIWPTPSKTSAWPCARSSCEKAPVSPISTHRRTRLSGPQIPPWSTSCSGCSPSSIDPCASSISARRKR